jgi:hypothetical protein
MNVPELVFWIEIVALAAAETYVLVRLHRKYRPSDRDRIPWRDLRATDDWRDR